MSFLRRVTPAATAPVTLEEAKDALQVGYDSEDTLIAALIKVAHNLISEMAGRPLVSETWALSFDAAASHRVLLPKSPVQSITSVTYVDADDEAQTAALSDFVLEKGDDRAVIHPATGKTWPTAHPDRLDAITVTFVAGFTTCPDTLKQAVLLTVAHLYRHRESVSTIRAHEVPFGVRALVDAERIGWVAA